LKIDRFATYQANDLGEKKIDERKGKSAVYKQG